MAVAEPTSMEVAIATLADDDPTLVISNLKPPLVSTTLNNITDDIPTIVVTAVDSNSIQQVDTTTLADDDPYWYKLYDVGPISTRFSNRHDQPYKGPLPTPLPNNINIGPYHSRETIALLLINGENNLVEVHRFDAGSNIIDLKKNDVELMRSGFCVGQVLP